MVKFSNFQNLAPESASLARELIDENEPQRSAFFPFMLVWMGFNGWMESVTGEHKDIDMIKAIADNERCTAAYKCSMDEQSYFYDAVMAFIEMWPVINVRDLRNKISPNAFDLFDREQLMNKVREKAVRHNPKDWVYDHHPTWAQLLSTIYAVRCNLFHGAKSSHNDRDRELVLACDRILRLFIEESRCFDWHDH